MPVDPRRNSRRLLDGPDRAVARGMMKAIGFTDEHDIGLYFKRMHVLNSLFGDEEFHVARFAQLPGFSAGLGERAG